MFDEGEEGWSCSAADEFAEDAVEVAGGDGDDGAVHFGGLWGDVGDDEEAVEDV